jgi:general L-amino acid transport system permease protein
MLARVHQTVISRPAPTQTVGAVEWVRLNLFGSLSAALCSLLVIGVMAWCLPHVLHWAVFSARWQPDAPACRAEGAGAGACWGVVAEKYRFILFGRYPHDAQWRPLVATALMVALLVASCVRALWRPALALLWLLTFAAVFALLYGNVFGLDVVETDRWGGLPLTMLLASLSIVMAFPLAIAVALGRRSSLPVLRALCIGYVELIRGVPLISVLFMASFMFPLLLPEGFSVDVLVRVLAGITLFAAAYMAEVIRGGLQAVPQGQVEAAHALGLSWWQTQRSVVLPQAITMVVPGLVNNFISIFKDTSLVTIVSLYELTGSLSLALNSDANWRPYKIEGYLFIAAIYFVFCFAMSRYSLRLERELAQ